MMKTANRSLESAPRLGFALAKRITGNPSRPPHFGMITIADDRYERTSPLTMLSELRREHAKVRLLEEGFAQTLENQYGVRFLHCKGQQGEIQVLFIQPQGDPRPPSQFEADFKANEPKIDKALSRFFKRELKVLLPPGRAILLDDTTEPKTHLNIPATGNGVAEPFFKRVQSGLAATCCEHGCGGCHRGDNNRAPKMQELSRLYLQRVRNQLGLPGTKP